MMNVNAIRVLALATALSLAAGALSRAAEEPAGGKSSATTQADVAKFYGVVTAVDTAAATFVVDGQTYHVTAESHLTKAADDKVATLADAVVGEPARGSYTKNADGQMNVTKVRFGKKVGGGKPGGGKAGGKKNAEAATQPKQEK
jgi:hypothetical protein